MPREYEVSFSGLASPTLRAAFGDCQLRDGPGVTVLRCTRDSLRNVMDRIDDFGLDLLEVRAADSGACVGR